MAKFAKSRQKLWYNYPPPFVNLSQHKIHQTCLRVQTSGTRQVVGVMASQLMDFMRENGVSNIGPESMQTFLKSMSCEVLDKFIAASENRLFQGTIGPGEALMTPFDFMYLESTKGDCDILGFRVSIFFKEDLDRMEQVSRWLIAVKKPNDWLQNACEALAA